VLPDLGHGEPDPPRRIDTLVHVGSRRAQPLDALDSGRFASVQDV
jgi:hypothetical protein